MLFFSDYFFFIHIVTRRFEKRKTIDKFYNLKNCDDNFVSPCMHILFTKVNSRAN